MPDTYMTKEDRLSAIDRAVAKRMAPIEARLRKLEKTRDPARLGEVIGERVGAHIRKRLQPIEERLDALERQAGLQLLDATGKPARRA